MAEHVHKTNNAQKEEENEIPRINNFAQKFLADLDEERERLGADFPLCALLIDEGNFFETALTALKTIF